MDPNYPQYPSAPGQSQGYPPQYPPGGNQYDFILNQGQKSRQKFGLPGGGNSRQTMLVRILIVLGGATVLVIIAAIVLNILGSANQDRVTRLVGLAQTQQEIIRISDLAKTKAKSPDTLNLATTAKLTAKTQQTKLLEILKKNYDTRLVVATLNLKKDKDNDTKLTEGENSNRFDEAFTEVLQANLTDYQQSLRSAFGDQTPQTEKTFLSNSYDQTTLLIGEQL